MSEELEIQNDIFSQSVIGGEEFLEWVKVAGNREKNRKNEDLERRLKGKLSTIKI